MIYTEEELNNLIKSVFTNNNYEGELVDLTSAVLARYSYLIQGMNISQLMEASFIRAKKLNSVIQHAADNFYPVYRGASAKLRVSNTQVIESRQVEKYEVLQQVGDYKLCFTKNDIFQIGVDLDIELFVALDSIKKELSGTDKLYLDIDDPDISEDLEISDNTGHIYKTTKKLHEIYFETSDAPEICIITMPNYSVRLFKRSNFESGKVYTIKYLKSPDRNSTFDINSLTGLSGFKNSDIRFNLLKDFKYKQDDLTDIYESTRNFAKFNDLGKSLNSLNETINELLAPYGVTGFKTIIGVDDIDVYYVMDFNNPQQGHLTQDQIDEVINKAKLYLVYQDFNFIVADPVTISDMEITIYYNSEIDQVLISDIINNYQSKVGVDFNPWNLISDLSTNENLIGKIRVEIPQQFSVIIPMNSNQRPYFENLQINYVSM